MKPHRAGAPRLAIVGNPNCGKTALFNLLTGSRQKVANYAGVTVERKTGMAHLHDGTHVAIIDLPGTYSLRPTTIDETITRDIVLGKNQQEAAPEGIIMVVDATNLNLNLRLALELKSLGIPMIVALNMMDVAKSHGLNIDVAKLSRELSLPVVETIGVVSNGHAALLDQIASSLLPAIKLQASKPASVQPDRYQVDSSTTHLVDLQREVKRILAIAVPKGAKVQRFNHRIDALVMHPVLGLVLLAALLFLVFQAVFSWANLPMEWIKAMVSGLADWVSAHTHNGPLQSLLINGIIAGVGSVLVFLPQILILFFFILLLEDSGYLPRAAFLLDNVMGKVGLSGRAFIPLLSSFACAIPGIMATRTIPNWRDRMATIMVAPLMTCSARLPIYALLIGAFVPEREIGIFNIRGLTLFGLYVAGIVSAMLVAYAMKRIWMKSDYQPLMLELPPYRLPNLRNLAQGLWERARIFIHRVGTIIFALMVLLWFLSNFPAPPSGVYGETPGPAIQYSVAGMIGHALQYVFAPIGFNWQICIALVPGMAAREVAVGALGTVYALTAAGDNVAIALTPIISRGWSAATAYSLLAWYVFAPQCLSTLAVVKRETNSWRYPILMAAYLFGLAYAASFITYRIALALA